MMKTKNSGGNCRDLLSAVIPLRNISLNAEVDKLLSNRAADDLISVLSGSKCSSVIEQKPNVSTTDTTNPVDYIYINSRGGCKKMTNNETCDCNKKMSGGCFTCAKGKKNLNIYYTEIVLVIPKLYRKYKKFNTDNKDNKDNKDKKMKGGESSFMDKISNLSNLSFKYKAFQPLDFNSQIANI